MSNALTLETGCNYQRLMNDLMIDAIILKLLMSAHLQKDLMLVLFVFSFGFSDSCLLDMPPTNSKYHIFDMELICR